MIIDKTRDELMSEIKGQLTQILETIQKCATKISEGDTTDEWSEILQHQTKKLKDFQSLVLKQMNEMTEEPKIEVFDVPVEIGMKVRCKITDYIGVVTVKHFNLHRVPQFCVQSKVNSMGGVGESILFDECQLEVINKEPVVKVIEPKYEIDLGECVLDSVTNFKGTVITRELHMNGCVRIRIRAEFIPGDKTSMNTAVFDEASVKAVKQRETVNPKPSSTTRGCAMTKTNVNWD